MAALDKTDLVESFSKTFDIVFGIGAPLRHGVVDQNEDWSRGVWYLTSYTLPTVPFLRIIYHTIDETIGVPGTAVKCCAVLYDSGQSPLFVNFIQVSRRAKRAVMARHES